MGCTPIAPTRTEVANPSSPTCSVSPRCLSSAIKVTNTRNIRCSSPSALDGRMNMPRSGDTLYQATLVNRQPLCLHPDATRVVMRHFRPSTDPRDLHPTDMRRMSHIVHRVLELNPQAVRQQLSDVLETFQGRHRHLLATLERRTDTMEIAHSMHTSLTDTQRRLIGAYFLHEYSFQAAALFNPSIVAHPDQSGVPDGERRFVLSLRAVGEGHVSSLTFRSGLLAADGTVTVDPIERLASMPSLQRRAPGAAEDCIEVVFEPDSNISERVIFPITEAQSNGIEDARFVEFDDGGRKTFYATYTAYDGRAIRSELLETTDFERFRM